MELFMFSLSIASALHTVSSQLSDIWPLDEFVSDLLFHRLAYFDSSPATSGCWAYSVNRLPVSERVGRSPIDPLFPFPGWLMLQILFVVTKYDPSGTVQQSHYGCQTWCLPYVTIIVKYRLLQSKKSSWVSRMLYTVTWYHLTWLKIIMHRLIVRQWALLQNGIRNYRIP